MNVTSTTQTQYITTNSTNTKTQDTSAYDEVAKTKQPTRYETLLAMGDNKSEAEKRELSYWSARRPMRFLDEEGNKALNKALEGKTDAEMFSIKSVLELEFMTSIKVNHETKTVDRQMFDSIDTSKDATIDRFENFMTEFEENGGVNTIGLMDVMGKFLDLYNPDLSTSTISQGDSVVDDFFEDLYSKESINFTSSVTKQDIQDQVKEYSVFLEQELGSSDEAKSTIANMIIKYKTTLMDELKKSINNTTSTVQEKQSAIKVLVDEKKDGEKSSLTALIGTDTPVNKSENVTKSNDGKAIPTVEELLDEKGMAHLNKNLYGMPEEDQIMIKLILSFQLSIKSENVVGGKLQIEWETGQLDSEAILKKLDLMIDKRKDRIAVNPLFTEKLDYIVDEMKVFYTDKSEANANSK